MPDIHIHRDHGLGLLAARNVARQWAHEAEQTLDMECHYVEGADSDALAFRRAGLEGRLQVGPNHFALDAKLGFLLGAFKDKIEAEITKNLDALLSPQAGDAPQGV